MYITRESADTYEFGRALGECLQAGDTVLLYGDLGAGKSVLARGIASALGVHEDMASPTFTLMQPYRGEKGKVYHFDLYRLSGEDELYAAGLTDHIGGDGVALIEWPQQADVCPPVRVEIDLMRMDDVNAREIDLNFFGMQERESLLRSAVEKWEKAI